MQLFCANNSIDEIITRYTKMVYGIAMTHVNNPADADDIYQEVFLAYFRKERSFNDEEHQKAWLIKTTLNWCKKMTGSSWRKKTRPLEEELLDQTFQFASEEENLVYQALCELPEKYRMVLYLFYFEEFTIDEMSKVLKIRAGTIRMQLTRGRDMMRSKLKGEYFYE